MTQTLDLKVWIVWKNMEMAQYKATEQDVMKLIKVERFARQLINMNHLKDDESFDGIWVGYLAGVDIAPIIGYIAKLCETKDYKARGHFKCTKENVIPEYKRTGKLILDLGHLKGLSKILAVDLGFCEDY